MLLFLNPNLLWLPHCGLGLEKLTALVQVY